MAQITIGSNNYDTFTDVPTADIYMAGDAALYEDWAALDDAAKGRAIISATRYFSALCWKAGDPPPFDDVPLAVIDACGIMAAMVASEPGLISGSSGSVNGQSGGQDVRRAEAGSASVEFFDPLRTPNSRTAVEYGSAASLPTRVSELLKAEDLLCSGKTRFGPYNGGKDKERCPDSCENGLTAPLS